VDMRIHFGSPIFEGAAETSKYLIYTSSVPSSDCTTRSKESFPLVAGILVQDEDGENVAKQKSDGDEANASENVETARAHGGETPVRRSRRVRDRRQI